MIKLTYLDSNCFYVNCNKKNKSTPYYFGMNLFCSDKCIEDHKKIIKLDNHCSYCGWKVEPKKECWNCRRIND